MTVPAGDTIHASCVAIGGRAVLIAGPSGSGKSDLALRLLDRGALLVSDDYTELRRDGDRLLAAPPATIAGRIEVRGVGIVQRPFVSDVPVALFAAIGVAERLPEPASQLLLGLAVPRIVIAALEPSAPVKLEIALTYYAKAAG